MIRVLLADDHRMVAQAMRLLLERIEGVGVIAEAHDGREALTLACEHRPDIAILDISMPNLNGIDAAMQMRLDVPQTRVLILSAHRDEDHVRRAVRAGVAGYVVKDSMSGELEAAIHAIMRGDNYLSPSISAHVMAAVGEPMEGAAAALDSLSARQRQILQLMCEGKSTKQVAFSLGVSIKTVETHRAALMDRLGIHNLPGLVLFALRTGLIQAGPD